jgi:hypothetical protein
MARLAELEPSLRCPRERRAGLFVPGGATALAPRDIIAYHAGADMNVAPCRPDFDPRQRAAAPAGTRWTADRHG